MVDHLLKKSHPYAYTTRSVVWKKQNLYIYETSIYGLTSNLWINEQLRKPPKPFQRDEAIDEILETFDPLRRRGLGAVDFAIPERIVELYDRGVEGLEGRGRGIRRTWKWRFTQGLSKSLALQMLNKINRFAPGTK